MELINRIFSINNSLNLNLRLISPVIFLCVIGLIALKSTSVDTLGVHSIFNKQLAWLSIGMLSFVLIQFLRAQVLYEFSYILYLILIVLLITTHFMPEINRTTRWIVFGSINFQPSELGKIIMIQKISNHLNHAYKIIKNHDIYTKEYLFDVFTKYKLYEEKKRFIF